MEWQPSEECTEGPKTHVRKALLGHGPLRQVLSPCSQTEKIQQGGGDDTRVFNTKSSFLFSCIFAQCSWEKTCILYNIQQKAVPHEFIFYVKLLIQATICTVV